MALWNDSVLAIYRIAQESAFEQFRGRALSFVRRLCAFDSARFGSSVITPAGLTMHYAHLMNEPPESLAAYEEVKSQDYLVIAACGKFGYGTGRSHAATHYGAPECRGLREYRRRFRHENVLCAYHTGARDLRTDYVSLYRADERAQFSEQEEGLVGGALPHLLEALHINAVLHLKELAPGALRAESYLGIADSLGAVLFAEPRACELLAEEWPSAQHGKLPPALFEPLASAGRYRGSRIHVAASRTEDMLFFRVRRRCLADSLSPRELEIARAIARGATHKTIAMQLGLSPETVRSHLKHIHHKLCVQNRAQLVAQLALSE
jgi:DNA-binding CsgD family transcriptional regulator